MAKGWCAYSWGIVSIQYVETLESKPFQLPHTRGMNRNEKLNYNSNMQQ